MSDVPQHGEPSERLERGLEPSGERVPVLLIFYRIPRTEHGQEWAVRHFQPFDVEKAQEFARKRGTQVVTSYVDVPRFAVHGWD